MSDDVEPEVTLAAETPAPEPAAPEAPAVEAPAEKAIETAAVETPAAPATEASWDMFGMPRTILVDNGSEFHGEALTRGCAEYGIDLTHRPVARPRFGAHIERLIGPSSTGQHGLVSDGARLLSIRERGEADARRVE